MDSTYWFLILTMTFLILCLLVKSSKYLHFKLKYFAYNCTLILLPLYGLFIGLLRPGNPDNFHRFAGFIYYIASRMFNITVETEGMENLDWEKIQSNFIIVSNHQSSVDMLCVLKVCPHYTTFVAKKELIYAPIFGQAAWLCGTVFVERANAKSARGAMDNAVKRIKSEKMNLWIFPEGTRRQEGTLLPFKKGAFHVAQQAQIPIVPVVISNYDDIFSKKTLTFKSGTLKVSVLPPVSTKGLTPDDVADLTDNIREQMLEVFHKQIPDENTQNQLKEKTE